MASDDERDREEDQERGARWENWVYPQLQALVDRMPTSGVELFVSGYGTLSRETFRGQSEKQEIREQIARLRAKLSKTWLPKNLTRAKDFADFTLVGTALQMPVCYVEMKTRDSHNVKSLQYGKKFDHLPVEPNVIRPHIGKPPKYPGRCLLIIAVENYENKGRRILWTFINETLAVGYHHNKKWKRKMYHPKIASFKDNAKEPFIEALRREITRYQDFKPDTSSTAKGQATEQPGNKRRSIADYAA